MESRTVDEPAGTNRRIAKSEEQKVASRKQSPTETEKTWEPSLFLLFVL